MDFDKEYLDPAAKLLGEHLEEESAIHRVWLGVEAASTKPRRRRSWLFAAAAAALVMLLAGAWWRAPKPLTLADGSSPVVAESEEGMTLRYDDGSEAELAAGSRLVPTQNDHEAIGFDLERGWARFSVQPGGPRAWVVRTERLEVRVLGTQFVVDARTSEVQVRRGRVEVVDRASGERREVGAGDRWRLEPMREPEPAASAVEPVPLSTNAEALPTRPSGQSAAAAAVSTAAPAPQPAVSEAASELAAQAETDWRALAEEGQLDAAFEALPNDPRLSLSDQMLGVDIARRAGRIDDAVRRLVAILDNHPQGEATPLAAMTLGRIERRRGRDAEAAAAFEKARSLGVPTSFRAEVCTEIALAYARLGEHERARREAAECLGTQPNSPFAASLRPLLRAE